MLAVLGGVGFGQFSSPNTSAVTGSVGRQHYGVASATLATTRMTGQAFSMGVAMLVLALAAGSGASGPGLFLVGVRACFSVFAALCVGECSPRSRGGRNRIVVAGDLTRARRASPARFR